MGVGVGVGVAVAVGMAVGTGVGVGVGVDDGGGVGVGVGVLIGRAVGVGAGVAVGLGASAVGSRFTPCSDEVVALESVPFEGMGSGSSEHPISRMARTAMLSTRPMIDFDIAFTSLTSLSGTLLTPLRLTFHRMGADRVAETTATRAAATDVSAPSRIGIPRLSVLVIAPLAQRRMIAWTSRCP